MDHVEYRIDNRRPDFVRLTNLSTFYVHYYCQLMKLFRYSCYFSLALNSGWSDFFWYHFCFGRTDLSPDIDMLLEMSSENRTVRAHPSINIKENIS